MSSSVPDSVSMSDLEKFAENASTPELQQPLYDGLTQEQVEALDYKTLNKLSKKCNDPMVEKVILMAICHSWIKWHSDFAKVAAEDGNLEIAIPVARDAGKMQAAFTLIKDVLVDNDFINPICN